MASTFLLTLSLCWLLYTTTSLPVEYQTDVVSNSSLPQSDILTKLPTFDTSSSEKVLLRFKRDFMKAGCAEGYVWFGQKCVTQDEYDAAQDY